MFISRGEQKCNVIIYKKILNWNLITLIVYIDIKYACCTGVRDPQGYIFRGKAIIMKKFTDIKYNSPA